MLDSHPLRKINAMNISSRSVLNLELNQTFVLTQISTLISNSTQITIKLILTIFSYKKYQEKQKTTKKTTKNTKDKNVLVYMCLVKYLMPGQA